MKRFLVHYKQYSSVFKEYSEVCIGHSIEELREFMHPVQRAKVKSIEEIEPAKSYRIGAEHTDRISDFAKFAGEKRYGR